MRTFRLIREVHAYCGLLLLLFTVMYAVSGFALMHPDRFPLQVDPTVTMVPIEFEGEPTEAELLDYLVEEFDVRGQHEPLAVLEDGSYSLLFERPGWTVRYEIASDLETAAVYERKGSIQQRLVDLHNVKGFSGGWANALWGLFLDLVSLAMLVFVVTGVYLWFIRKKDHRLGWALLCTSWGLLAGTVAYLYLAP